jgi:YD repeat-containing protein
MRKTLKIDIAIILIMAVAFVCFHMSDSSAVVSERAVLPNTTAGRCAAAYITAFNSGDENVMREFDENNRSFSYLDDLTLDERAANYRRLRGIFGQLTPLRVALNLELQITLLANSSKIEDVLVIRFQIERDNPHRLQYITFTGIDHAHVPDDYAAYVATRAAPIEDSLRDSTIHRVAEILGSKYIYPKRGREMMDTIMQNNYRERYNECKKAGKLADMLTEDVVTVSNDRHVWVEAQNPMAQGSTDPMNASIEELRSENYHLRKVEILSDNIGYMKFDMIHDDKEAQDLVANGLSDLADCDALIFDIRDNVGGEWGTANLIIGYLLPPNTVLARVYDRDGRLVEQRSTPDTIPGRPFDIFVPVYILTSNRTGSAAEGFAYVLKHMGRATIVGEVTLGMAHPSEEIVVNDYFRVSVPFLRSENVITGTDWEGKGVIPDIKVNADSALNTAVNDALQKMRDHN